MQSRWVDVTRALDQIAEIHQQIAKGEMYRGYRSLPLAASGLMGLAAAWLQPSSLGSADPIGFVVYWTAIAAGDRKSTRLNSSHCTPSRMPSSA